MLRASCRTRVFRYFSTSVTRCMITEGGPTGGLSIPSSGACCDTELRQYCFAMRVIAGQYRSRPLQSLPGMDTRPTSDRLRGTLFNVLAAGKENALHGTRWL